jgi:hypothetical protein
VILPTERSNGGRAILAFDVVLPGLLDLPKPALRVWKEIGKRWSARLKASLGGTDVILPTKRISQDRALLAVGAEVLSLLDQPKTVSQVWEELRKQRSGQPNASPVVFDWFVLAVDLLYAVRAVELEKGRLRRVTP